MTIPNKSTSAQMFRLNVYQRALHPELVKIQDRRTTRHNLYELESWIMPAGHVLRFQSDGQCVTEAVTDQDVALPERGLIQTVLCMGEKEVDETVEEAIRYVSTVQTEFLSDNLYLATFQEMKDFADETQAMTYEWQDPDGTGNLSVLDIQRFRKEVHAQSYHLLGGGGLVLRTQTIFEIE
jgi:hypothetical protein